MICCPKQENNVANRVPRETNRISVGKSAAFQRSACSLAIQIEPKCRRSDSLGAIFIGQCCRDRSGDIFGRELIFGTGIEGKGPH